MALFGRAAQAIHSAVEFGGRDLDNVAAAAPRVGNWFLDHPKWIIGGAATLPFLGMHPVKSSINFGMEAAFNDPNVDNAILGRDFTGSEAFGLPTPTPGPLFGGVVGTGLGAAVGAAVGKHYGVGKKIGALTGAAVGGGLGVAAGLLSDPLYKIHRDLNYTTLTDSQLMGESWAARIRYKNTGNPNELANISSKDWTYREAVRNQDRGYTQYPSIGSIYPYSPDAVHRNMNATGDMVFGMYNSRLG